jgi:glucose-1-phosphate cytidylyltransferase
MIKEYFANYFLHMSDVTFHMKSKEMEIHNNYCDDWKVTLINTGETSLTGGRLKRVRKFIGDETFCFTYGDGLSSVDITKLIAYHKEKKLLATVTAIQPPGRFGSLKIEEGKVSEFQEKPQGDGGFINGGFFVLEPKAIDLVDSDETAWELEPMQRLTTMGQLSAYTHYGFWKPMDTVRDKMQLEEMWTSGKAPWKVW